MLFQTFNILQGTQRIYRSGVVDTVFCKTVVESYSASLIHIVSEQLTSHGSREFIHRRLILICESFGRTVARANFFTLSTVETVLMESIVPVLP